MLSIVLTCICGFNSDIFLLDFVYKFKAFLEEKLKNIFFKLVFFLFLPFFFFLKILNQYQRMKVSTRLEGIFF